MSAWKVTRMCAGCGATIEDAGPGAKKSHGWCEECEERDFPDFTCSDCGGALENPSATICDHCNIDWGDGSPEEA